MTSGPTGPSMATPGLVCAISAIEGARPVGIVIETSSPSTHGSSPSLRTTSPAVTTAVVSHGGGTDRPGGRPAGTPAPPPARSRSPPPSGTVCSSPFSSSTMDRSGCSGAHWASAVAEEELAPTAGFQPHGRTRRLRLGPSDPSGRARTSPSSGSRIGARQSAAPVASSMRTPAVQTASDLRIGRAQVRERDGCDRAERMAITPVVVGSAALGGVGDCRRR